MMREKYDYNPANYSYVFSAKKRLELESGKKGHNASQRMKNKLAVAAAIAMASGSVVLFTPNGKVQAADVDSNVQTEQVESKQQDQQKSDAKDAAGQEIQTAGKTNDTNDQVNSSSKVVSDKVQDVSSKDDDDQDEDNVPKIEQRTDEQTDSENVDYNSENDRPVNTPDLAKGNVFEAWDNGYHGEHIAVAVIDTGVDVDHQDFAAASIDPKFSEEEMKKIIEKLGHGRYVSSKIPYVHNVVTNDDSDMKEHPEKDDIPHGQHVSGTIVADGHPDSDHDWYVKGVALQAQLIFLRKSEKKTGAEIATAIYDAVKVGADVISISLGGNL
ncbi:hypothetical protein EJK20_00660 [Lactobacillus xujianguonis]|nr:hypothetical protein EJK20_00660 [Lactobacillus xujianguonis]